MFTGLSAFPHTPLRDDAFDEAAYTRLLERLTVAGVDSITALGSTGSYMYFDREERRRVAQVAVRHAGLVPVIVGIGALRTSQVQKLAEDAQEAGARAVLLAPVTYQALGDDEVFDLFKDVTADLSVPLVVYDNPGTTHVTFTDDLYARIATLPQVASIKIPGVPADPDDAAARVRTIRDQIPGTVTVGVSGDSFAATGLNAGCDAWYSVIGGTLPVPALTITRAALAGDHAAASAESARLQPLWALFAAHGSYRVTAAIAEHLGLVAANCLPRPVQGLGPVARARVAQLVDELRLDD
ncbi:dihydrodipicolinate synthase family protein [Cryobacterium sp. TMT1-3]|uniref:Dihydrodipicolinate synthase family protein n=1 Tax=Cryobacterium luteum TaxID=1424661 RepID=A0A1H8DRY3_9MICO|nr:MULTISPECIES: dihydrodipicolinate synthase family protein [Cryobacterium]TFB89704.1 dihydrodipicolinate synthase family protein [Cryobacterium luteum]TFC25416.1 dihydrodipicolinate synthase family protein [Cryobacterium sp. TMT1-3]SEN09926.1 4-hydroxy-tetrahydrodipicolinate synthase [Cryobacterium luteum]